MKIILLKARGKAIFLDGKRYSFRIYWVRRWKELVRIVYRKGRDFRIPPPSEFVECRYEWELWISFINIIKWKREVV